MIRKALVKRGGQIVEVTIDDSTYKDGGSNMIKRKDGSYSQRGLWDNIRANKGSGKKPTKQMLEQERKIKRNKKQTGGEEIYGNYMLPEFEITENTGMYNPNIVGPSAPRYIPSETGFVPNPYYTTGSGSAESVPLEMFAAPIMRGASSLIGMIPQNVMTGLGAGTMLGLEGCAPGQKCKGFDALPQRTKYKTSKRKKRRRQEGGEEDFYTPDTGIEQFAPDQSWYEGNPNASAPGNVVSWPSYPKGTGIPMSELPPEAMPQRIPSSQGSIYPGTGRYAGRPSNSMLSLDNNYSRYQEDMPEYRRSFDLFNRIGQGFNNMGEAIGDGFDNLSDFFQRMKKNRKRARRERRGRRGNGLKSCKSGVGCAKFIKQEGGEESDQMEEILDQIEDALEQGVQPEEILLQLTEMGIDEEQAQMLIEEAIQDLQEDAQEEEGNGEENNGEENEIEEAQKGLETNSKRKRNLVSKSDYEKMQADQKLKKEIEEKKAIEQKAIRESKYYNNPSSLRNFDPIKFNDPNIQTNVKKECRSGEYVWEYQPCPEEIQTSNLIEKPEGTYSNSPTGKYYYVNLPNSGLGRSDEVQINPRDLQRYFNNYNLKYSGSGSSAYGDAPINANLMYDSDLPVGEYYDLNQSYKGEPIHYYNTPNAQFFPDTYKEYGGDVDMFGNGGSYRVYRTSERKGKTHKVVGPGGVTKYFGDPKLGERSKSKYGKKGFYARHKKNLAKNPFFRAYARATWAEGGEPSFMQTPEFKTNSFVDLVRQEAESNAYKNIMDQAQEMYMQMGGAQDYGYVGNPYASMYQKNIDDLEAKGNVEGAVFNAANQVGLAFEDAIKKTANIVAPGSGGAIVGMAMDAQRPKSLTDPTSKGMSGDGIASMLKGVISDPEALTGFLARYGGSMRKFQNAGQFVPPKLSDEDFNADVYGNLYDENGNLKNFTPLPPQQEGEGFFESPEDWRKRMEKESAIVGDNKNWDPLAFSKSDMDKYNLDPNFNNVVQKPKTQMPGGGIDWLGIGRDLLTAMGNRGKAEKEKIKRADMTAGDNVFAAAETLNRGDFERNTGMKKPNKYGEITKDGIPALARYGGGLRRAKQGGIQKDGVYMSYPTATPESVVYGEQPKKPSNTLQPVKRELANLEAEGGETAITPAGVDGVPKFWKIGGERHSNGGTPLNLPDGSFIFSDTKSMKLGGDILEELGIKGKKKKRTPAEISKMLGIGKGYDKYVMIIQDPNSDKIERRTAELMIENQIKKLGMLALAQEAKKGFPEGIPMIAVPYMESVGIAPEQILPQPQMGMEEMSMPQQMPMAKYGMQKYQTGREKQTDILGMDPNAPFPISSVSTPDNPNIAERILGPLFNYFASKPKKEETPIEANVQPVEVFSPVKGFESMDDLDKFISKGDEFGQDFNALYNDYSETIKTIDQLRTGLIEGWIPLEEYEQYKEGIDSRIGEIKTEIDESQKRIPFYKSWGFNPSSTADKLQDIAGILDEEKDKLKFRASDLRKFRNFQNNVSFLETEKQNILELLNSDIDNLERMRLKRRLTDVNDALNYETDRTNQFGEKAFKTSKSVEGNTPTDFNVIIDPERTGYIKRRTYDNQPLNLMYRKFTYDDYLKQYESSPITSKAKPSYESQQGSLNAVQDTVPAVQDTVPVVAPSTSAPTQSKPKSSEKQVQKKPSLNIKVVSEEDKQYF